METISNKTDPHALKAIVLVLVALQGFPSQYRMSTTFSIACEMFFNRCQILYLHHKHCSVVKHDFQHMICWTEFDSSL